MKEKKYPVIEEESGFGCMAAEENVLDYANHSEIIQRLVCKGEDSNVMDADVDEEAFPMNSESAVGKLRNAERQFDQGQFLTSEDFFKKTRKLISSYAS